ncbi:MAG: endonuclease/exonuclease/phosphatase family protein [Bdellovibrionales bacterium]|jgi:endonuclease/exonuclease/phosphatase family metal-dependent hydrolase|nr:endonuclease/exonuclease/phosphatase family protein [Bdellovibrionales bacterium]
MKQPLKFRSPFHTTRTRHFAAMSALALVPAALFALVVGCTSFGGKKAEQIQGPRVSIMTYNVENLFDTEHDEGTEDFTYLPLARKSERKIREGCNKNSSTYRRQECLEKDWNEKVLEKKMRRLAAVFKQLGDGKGPDIAILAEVENQRVLELFRDRHLKDSGYVTATVIDSFDPRGIDPAVLSRFPMWREPKIHRIPMKAADPDGEYAATRTRGLLEVPALLPDGTKALLFGLHFPSQANPTYLRKQAVEFLNQIEKDLPPDVVAIVGGDFNITRTEDATEGYFKTTLNDRWQVAHIDGCKKCEGTHYFHPKTEWSFLDSLLVRRASIATTGWRLDPESVRIPNGSKYQVNRYGSPARFGENSAYGVSDHWPVYMEIVKPASDTKSATETPAAPAGDATVAPTPVPANPATGGS